MTKNNDVDFEALKAADVFEQWMKENKRYKAGTIFEYAKKVNAMLKLLGSKPKFEAINAYINLRDRQYSLQYAARLWLISLGRQEDADRLEMGELLERETPYKMISREEFLKVLGRLKTREQKMVAIIVYHTGIRIREAVELREKHLLLEEKHITLRIKAKRGKMRDVVIHKGYWLMFKTFMDDKDNNFLFIDQSFRKLDKYVYENKLQGICKNRFWLPLKKAGANWSHHHLRSTKIKGCDDVGLAQKLAGHSRISTTLRYRPIDQDKVFAEMLKDDPCRF